MSRTHYDGQKLAECDCGRTIRLQPERARMNDRVYCGSCGNWFTHGSAEV